MNITEITKEELLARYADGEHDFSGLDLSGMVFGRCVLNGCNFREANFSYADFSNWTHIMHCDFRDTTFFRANLSPCAFSGSNFSGADMQEVTFEGGEGIGVIFENTNFKGAKGSFVHEGTLCLHNCIGRDGNFIELLNEETVIRELDSRYVNEWNGIPMEQILRIGLTSPYSINSTKIPDIPF